jgi:hypothetical protein
VLLAKKAHTIEQLACSRTRRIETFFQIGVLDFQTFDSLRVHARATGCGLERLYARFSLKGASSERCELGAEVADELLKLFKCLQFRTFAV